MIKRLYVDNYKCFVNFDLHLQSLTLLLGRNGAGKTSVLDIMFALRELLSGRVKITDTGIFPESTLTAWQSRESQSFEIEVELDDEVYIYRLVINHNRLEKVSRIEEESLMGKERKYLFNCEFGEVQLYRDNLSVGPKYSVDWKESALARVPSRHDNTRLTKFLEFIRTVVVCGMYPASFQPETTGHEEILKRDANNFAAWYQHQQLENPDRIEKFRRKLEEVIDGFDGIRLEKTGIDRRAFRVSFLEENQEKYELSLDEVSDGQRALLALYALTELSTGMSSPLYLDEPENYVALAEIQPWLVELGNRCGESIPQAVVCSHHPELIDYLGSSHGVLLDRELSGATRVLDLSESISNEEGGLKLSEVIARGWEH
ncbi:MAG: ATP-binding protein [Gammaproteobacteria bacterium]|nr:ATP-binding protein [Gammaproteobacteria bacterium]MYE30247.1 ATP-binding protein [Gammaproteobacteria bacterium]